MSWKTKLAAIKKWCLAPEKLPEKVAEPVIVDIPYWQRDPTIGQPVVAMMMAFRQCPARFKFRAEYRVLHNTFYWQGAVHDSITGESFKYSGNTSAGGGQYTCAEWKPLTHWTWYFLVSDTRSRISQPSVDVPWMTPKEQAFVRSVVTRSLEQRKQRVVDYQRNKEHRKHLREEAIRNKILQQQGEAERKRLIEIYQ